MNPWGLLVIGIGVVLIIIGVKGSQHNIAGVIVGKHPTSKVTSAGTKAPNVGMA